MNTTDHQDTHEQPQAVTLVCQSDMLWRRLRSYLGDMYYSMSITRRGRVKHAADRAFERYWRRRTALETQQIVSAAPLTSVSVFFLADVGRSSVQSAEVVGQESNND